MTPDTVSALKDLSPIAAAVGVIFLVVKLFINYLDRKDTASAAALERFDRRIEDMSKSYFNANSETNKIIGNHIEHATAAMDEMSETNRKLTVAVETIIEVLAVLKGR